MNNSRLTLSHAEHEVLHYLAEHDITGYKTIQQHICVSDLRIYMVLHSLQVHDLISNDDPKPGWTLTAKGKTYQHALHTVQTIEEEMYATTYPSDQSNCEHEYVTMMDGSYIHQCKKCKSIFIP